MRETDSKELTYTTPTVEICDVEVEGGYTASFGDVGEAGDDFDTNDNGVF